MTTPKPELSAEAQTAAQNQQAMTSAIIKAIDFETLKKLLTNGLHIHEKAAHFDAGEIHDLAHWMHGCWVAQYDTRG